MDQGGVFPEARGGNPEIPPQGARIAVIGTLDHHKWETDEGIQRASFQLIANSLEFIKTDGRGFEEGKAEDDIPF